MKKPTSIGLLVAGIALSGCAQPPDQVEASYVSPNQFKGRSCSQLMSERNEIVRRVNDLTQQQKEAATTDAVATGVALVVFWPAAFVLAATEDNATALSAAKGNYDAITTQMKSQGCTLPPEPVQAAPKQTEKKKDTIQRPPPYT